MTNRGYHPLEELKVCKKNWETHLTSAEIARTVVEVCVYNNVFYDMCQICIIESR